MRIGDAPSFLILNIIDEPLVLPNINVQVIIITPADKAVNFTSVRLLLTTYYEYRNGQNDQDISEDNRTPGYAYNQLCKGWINMVKNVSLGAAIRNVVRLKSSLESFLLIRQWLSYHHTFDRQHLYSFQKDHLYINWREEAQYLTLWYTHFTILRGWFHKGNFNTILL